MYQQILIIRNSELITSKSDLDSALRGDIEKYGPWIKKFDSEDIMPWYENRAMEFIEEDNILYPAYTFLNDLNSAEGVGILSRHRLPIKKVLKYTEYLYYLAIRHNLHADKNCLWEKNPNNKFEHYYIDIKKATKKINLDTTKFNSLDYVAVINNSKWVDYYSTDWYYIFNEIILNAPTESILCPVTISKNDNF